MKTLWRFIAEYPGLPYSAHVRHKEFRTLYVRLGPRYICDRNAWYFMLDFAHVVARHPGRGAFTRLLQRVRTQYPEIGLYVENVLTDRFASGLTDRLGFTADQTHLDCCYSITQTTRLVNLPRIE